MRKRVWKAFGVVCSVAILAGLCGCLVTEQPAASVLTARAGGSEKIEAAAAQSTSTKSYAWQGFPGPVRSPREAQILVEKEAPREVKLNHDYVYELRVSNQAKYSVSGVVVTDVLPSNFALTKVNPVPHQEGQQLKWDLGTLSPGQARRITVTGKITKPGRVNHSGAAAFNYVMELSTPVDAVEATLDLSVEGATDVVISDEIPVHIQLRNDGTAPARDVKLECALPKGLLTKEGTSKIDLSVGTVQPGQAVKFDMPLSATSIGRFESRFVATASGGLSKSASLVTTVRKPKLSIVANAPPKRFVNNIILYKLTVTNIGDAEARKTVIRQELPDGTQVISADEGGKVEGASVVWDVGTLKPKEAKEVTTRVVGKRIMMVRSVASATAHAADRVEEAMTTDVAGIAALLLEVGDINDPVPVGETEKYEVRVTNQGSLPATKIELVATLEPAMEFVKAKGASKPQAEGNVIRFEALPALDPQGVAVWELTVKAKDEGDVRFRVSVNSDQLSRPVEESEATHFYK
ncbi:MAG: hypothetical protein JXR37_01760 [Kiritimatiellae bacterium]|nr:hypothetical protein [Kiritimatiellia bacterium]